MLTADTDPNTPTQQAQRVFAREQQPEDMVGTLLYLALGFIFHPFVVGVPVFGAPAY